MDDFVITGTDKGLIREFKDQMKMLFKMSELGLLSYYLGIQVSQTEGEITLHQRSYAEKILEVAGMEEYNSSSTQWSVV